MTDTIREGFDYVYKYFEDWTLFEKAWLLTFSLISFYVFFTQPTSTLISLVASLTGIITVVLVAKGRISNYYFGIINVVLYAFLAYQSQYYGEVMLNALYFLPMQFIGLYLWKKNPSEKSIDSVKVAYLSQKQRVLLLCGAIVSIIGYGLFLQILHGNLPFFDATSTVLSVIAQYLMVKRVKEQWIAWIIIDIVSIYLWISAGVPALTVMWTAYLVNAVYGWYNWRKMEQDTEEKEQISLMIRKESLGDIL